MRRRSFIAGLPLALAGCAMRRPGTGAARRVSFRGIGGVVSALPSIDLLTLGTLTRSTAATYYTGVGATPLGASAIDTQRVEDGELVIEGAYVVAVAGNGSGAASSPWSAGTGRTAGAAAGADGAANGADRCNVPSGSFGMLANYGSFNAGNYVFQHWIRRRDGDGPGTMQSALAASVNVGWQEPITETWERFWRPWSQLSGFVIPWEGRGVIAGTTAQAIDYLGDNRYINVAEGVFPRRPVPASGTKGADIKTILEADIPADYFDAGFVFRFRPDCDSTDFTTEDRIWTLVSRGADDYVRMWLDDANFVAVELWCSGVLVAARRITFAAGQQLTIAVSPGTGVLKVSGAMTGSGTSTGVGDAWPSGNIRIGSSSAGTNGCFGRFAASMTAYRAPATQNTVDIVILLVGDSLTAAQTVGYRAALYDELVLRGYTAAFIGTLDTFPGGSLPLSFRHEGVFSETVDTLIHERMNGEGWGNDTTIGSAGDPGPGSRGHMEIIVANASTNICVLFLGATNDAAVGAVSTTKVSQCIQCMCNIGNVVPGTVTRFGVLTPTPRLDNGTANDRLTTYRGVMDAQVIAPCVAALPDVDVRKIDIATNFDTGTDLDADLLHFSNPVGKTNVAVDVVDQMEGFGWLS